MKKRKLSALDWFRRAKPIEELTRMPPIEKLPIFGGNVVYKGDSILITDRQWGESFALYLVSEWGLPTLYCTENNIRDWRCMLDITGQELNDTIFLLFEHEPLADDEWRERITQAKDQGFEIVVVSTPKNLFRMGSYDEAAECSMIRLSRVAEKLDMTTIFVEPSVKLRRSVTDVRIEFDEARNLTVYGRTGETKFGKIEYKQGKFYQNGTLRA